MHIVMTERTFTLQKHLANMIPNYQKRYVLFLQKLLSQLLEKNVEHLLVDQTNIDLNNLRF